MKSAYLAFGSQAAAVRDARPTVTLVDHGREIPLLSFHSGSRVGKVKSGAQVTVLSEEGSWSRIQYGGLTGYVMSAYLK